MKKQEFNPLSIDEYQAIKVGDVLERMLGFAIPCYVTVVEITDDFIDCGWVFDRNTGLEIDEDIPVPVSYISKVLNEEEKLIIKNGGKLG